MIARSLNPSQEPIFALLLTDPRSAETASGSSFGDIAAEFLRPRSYGETHVTGVFPGAECNACAPHRVMFLASPQGRARSSSTVREGVIVQHPRARRTKKGK
jgi:hypothetical protein